MRMFKLHIRCMEKMKRLQNALKKENIDHLEILETNIRDILYRWINIVTSKRVCTI